MPKGMKTTGTQSSALTRPTAFELGIVTFFELMTVKSISR
jgi:hypothetical protein